MNRLEYNARMKAVEAKLAEVAQLEEKISWQKYNPDQNIYGDMQEGEGMPVSRQIGQGVDAFASGVAKGATFGALGDSGDQNSRFGRAEQAHPIINFVGDMAGSMIPIAPLSVGASMVPGLSRFGSGLLSQMARIGATETIAGGAYGGIKAGLGTGELSDVPKEAAMWGAMGAAMPVVGKGAKFIYDKIKRKPPLEVPIEEVVAKPNAITQDVKQLTPEELTAAQARLREKVKPTELGAGANPKKLWEKLPQSFRNVFTGAKNRIKTDEGKKVVGQFEDVFRERGVLGGEIEENLREVGLNQLNRKQRNMLSDALQGKAVADEQVMKVASGVKPIIEKMHEMATGVGMNIGKIANYFPRMIKSDIAVALNGDLSKMTKGLKDLNLTDKQYIQMFRERALAREGISKYMQDAIKKAEAEGKDVGEYLYSLYNQSKGGGFLTPFGNLEKSRMTDLPSTFYETDAGIVLGRYINGWSRRVAETKSFGQDMAGLKKQLTDLTMGGNADAQELRKLAKVLTEVTEFENALSPTMAKWVRRGTNLAVTTKIGTGFATMLQATQPLISIIPKAGVLRTIQGGLKLLDPAVRKSVRQSGAAPFADAVGTLTGQHLTESVSSRITNAATTASGFKGANKMLQYLAASTGKVYIENLHKIARGSGSRAQWASGMLKKFGINSGEALSKDTLEKGMFQFAMDSQLQRNALRDPIWMNDPRLRPLALFKRFGLRQAEYIKNDIVGEIAEGKNIFPLLRLGAGAYLGGEFAVWAKNELTEIMTGKEQYRASDPFTADRFLENIAAVGALGTLSDLTRTDEVAPWKKFGDRAGNAAFSLLPAIGSEVRQGLVGEGGKPSMIKRFADLADRKGPAKAFSKMLPDVVGTVSPIGGRLAQRFESGTAQDNQYKYLRGKESARIAYLILNGDKEQGMSRLKKWNATNPRYAIRSENITNAAKSLQESMAGE